MVHSHSERTWLGDMVSLSIIRALCGGGGGVGVGVCAGGGEETW